MAKNQKRNLSKINGIWYFRIQLDGKPLKKSLGVTREATAKDLRDQYLANLAKYGQLDPPGPENEPEEDITFGEFAKKWASIHKAEVKYSTWRDYVSIMNGHVLPYFKDRPIDDISYMEILEFRKGLNVGAKRANNIMVPMKSVFDMAFQEGLVSENVMRKVKRLREEPPDINPFTYDEINKILSVIEPWYRPYTQLAFFTGMRAGELNALKWVNYHEGMLNGPEIHIRLAYVYGQDGSVKTKKSNRNIECLPEAVDALTQQTQLTGGGEYIFLTRDGKRMSPDHFREVVWKPALKKAGIAYRPPIQTRHTFATMMLSANEEVGWVQNMLGHSSLQMIFQRYYAWIPQKTRSNGQAFQRYVESLEQQNENVAEKDADKLEVVNEEEKIESCTNIVPMDAYRRSKEKRKVLTVCNK